MTPMQLGVQVETEILKLALTVGVFMGVIYDLLRIVRRTFGHKAVTYGIDFLYALMFASVFFVFSLAQTDYVRGFILCAMVLGAIAWTNTVGRITLAIINKIGSLFSKKIVKNCSNLENDKKIGKST